MLSKMIKNRIKQFISITVICVSSILFTGCKPYRYNPDVIDVNEKCDIYQNNELVAYVTYNGCAEEELPGNLQMILIKETITINPLKKINLSDKDFLLGLGYEMYDSVDEMYRTDISSNIEKNQFNIFEYVIDKEVAYEFCFIIPKEKNYHKYND